MGVFKEVTLEWDGETHVIPSNRVMGAIARVEEFVTLKELSEFSQAPQGAKYARLAQAYGSLLRYAGARVEDDEVYAGMFPKSERDVDFRVKMYDAIGGLLTLMLPPSSMSERVEAAAAEGKQEPIAAKSSRRPTEQRSETETGTGDSDPVSSGGSTRKSSGGSQRRSSASRIN